MKILELNTVFRPGGIQRHTLDLARYLEANGHVVYIGGTPGVWAGPGQTANFLDLPTLMVSKEGGSLPVRLWALVRSTFRLRAFVKQHALDLVHSHESAPALVARLALLGTGVKQVVTYHGSEPSRVRSFAKTVAHADVVITPSHASANDLVKMGGLPAEQVKVIGLGLQHPPASDEAEIEELRKKLLAGGKQLVVTIARLTRQKGIDILIDCVARLQESHPHIHFALVGPGPEEKELKALAERRGVLGHLTFVGATQRPYDYLRAGDLFLLTSRWESLPFTIPEAFQVGRPAVATACSGVVELIDDSVGRVVPIGDIDAICQAVTGLLDDPDTLSSLSKAALERSKEDRFNPAWTCRQMEELYQEVLAAG